MRSLAPAALALLVLLPAAEIAHAQSRTGRATGSTGRASSTSSGGRVGEAVGRANTGGSRLGTTSGRSATERASGRDVVRSRSAVERSSPSDVVRSRSTQGRASGSTGIASRSPSTWSETGRSQPSADRGRTAVSRGTVVNTNRGIASRTSGATGVASRTERANDRVVYGPPLRGSAVGSSSRDYYYDRGRYRPYDRRTYYRRPIIHPVWPVTLIRTCPFSFGFGWGGGFACFRTYFTAGIYVPFVYTYPTAVINVHTSTTHVTTAPRTYDVYEDARCAVVSVITPGNDGYWKTLRLPANGALDRDQLQRLISDRLADGYPFLITDADGVRIEVPAAAQVDRVTIDPCR